MLFEDIDKVLKILKPIRYGFHSRYNGKDYMNDDLNKENFYRRYLLQSPQYTFKHRIGVCWDTVELMRKLFSDNGYLTRSFYFQIYDNNNEIYKNHTVLLVSDDGIEWYYVERSWEILRTYTHEDCKVFENDEQMISIVDFYVRQMKIVKDLSYYQLIEYPKPRYWLSPIQFERFVKNKGRWLVGE